jgi:hypothetical protein
MTVEQRLERIERNLRALIQIHMVNDPGYRQRFDRMLSAVEAFESRAADGRGHQS